MPFKRVAPGWSSDASVVPSLQHKLESSAAEIGELAEVCRPRRVPTHRCVTPRAALQVQQLLAFGEQLDIGACSAPEAGPATAADVGMPADALRASVSAALATVAVHCESRVAAAVGEAFYTIGPGGEELLAPTGLLLKQGDSCALHYRHLAIQMVRQLPPFRPSWASNRGLRRDA